MKIRLEGLEIDDQVSTLSLLSENMPQFEADELNKPIDIYQKYDKKEYNTRDFGVDECTEAAKQIFPLEVISNWEHISPKVREQLSKQYANKVATAFELKQWGGLYFDPLDPSIYGYNNGDGTIHLNDDIVKDVSNSSPIELIDTITHEMRHQYQYEAVEGLHNVSPDVVKEWKVGFNTYTSSSPWAQDPWGYKFNPLEIDANYVSQTVVREMTKDLINNQIA